MEAMKVMRTSLEIKHHFGYDVNTMTRRFPIILALLAALFLPFLTVQAASPFAAQDVEHHQEGADHFFTFNIRNAESQDLRIHGRLVVINVYDTTRPVTLPIEEAALPKGGTASVTLKWSDAPVIGPVRALLVLSDGNRTFVETYDFWLFPTRYAVYALLVLLVAVTAALIAMRSPKAMKKHVPANMVSYVVEFNDTVVTLSNDFGVTWQDIVKANRLAPPYALKPGRRILIPKHPLQKPKENG